jgi:Fic family protein
MAKWDINFDFFIDIDHEITEYQIKAEAYRQLTARLPLPPYFAEQVNRINIVRQIKGTTGLEGNLLSENEIENLIQRKDSGKVIDSSSIQTKEIENAYDVQKYIVSLKDKQQYITEDFIKHLHYLSTKDIPSDINNPGHYRTSLVHAGEYSPPEPAEIPDLMNKYIELMNSRRPEFLSPLFKAIVAHFFLVTIHPFGDGNGRTSRALEAFILYSNGFNTRGFYSLANFFYKNRDRYIQELQDARFKYNADLSSFVKFALGGLVKEIEAIQDEVIGFIKKLMFRSYVEELFAYGKISARCAAIIDYVSKTKSGIPLQQIYERKDPVIRGLYEGIKTDRTIDRDISLLKKENLVFINEDKILTANVSVLQQFEG